MTDGKTSIGLARLEISAGGGVLNSQQTAYGTSNAKIAAAIPIGKNVELQPKIAAFKGKDVNGLGASLGAEFKLNKNLSLNAGAGVRQVHFSGVNETKEYDYADAQETLDQGETDLSTPGDFVESGTIYIENNNQKVQTEGYAFADAKYKVNPKLSVKAGLEGGVKHINAGSTLVTKEFEGERFVKTQDGRGYIEQYSGSTQINEDRKSNSFVGGVRAGMEYDINKNLALGAESKIGIGHNADTTVGLNLKFKF